MSDQPSGAGAAPETQAPEPQEPRVPKPLSEAAARNARFRAVARQAPEAPGVYLMRDSGGTIIYVGKAKVLKNRLLSYFSGKKDVKTRHLVARVESIEWVLAGSEYDALLIENNFIKEHSPRYNINLKDGKTYPSIRITADEYPRVFRTRRIIHDGSEYFGPFPSAEIIDVYLELIKRLFPLRRCVTMKKREQPCMYYHIGRCPGPCAGRITHEAYMERVAEIRKLLSGKTRSLIADLQRRMDAAAREFRFEEAAGLRDAIRAVEQFEGRSKAVDFDPAARDYVAWAADGDLIAFVVFQMREGKLTGRDSYRSEYHSGEDEAIQNFLVEYYGQDRTIPPTIYLMKPLDTGAVGDWLDRDRGARASFAVPSDSRHGAAMNMAAQNAREELIKRRREIGDIPALIDLRRILGLQALPARIEGFDIAQLSGRDTVASLVSFRNGVPDRKNYRHFRIKSLEGRIDDFGAVREAVARRYTRLINEEAELPDLILIDGGAGQVSAAREILDTLGLDCDLAGLAKRNEEIWLPGRDEPIVLPKDSPALRVLVAVRDETHRFATGLSRTLRSERLSFGVLEDIKGVGPARAKKIMRTFGSLDLVARADAEDIARAGGMPLAVARAVKDALGR